MDFYRTFGIDSSRLRHSYLCFTNVLMCTFLVAIIRMPKVSYSFSGELLISCSPGDEFVYNSIVINETDFMTC